MAQTEKKLLRQIALVSFLILFLELLVIRLVGTEIRIFAYLSNLVLLAAFVGSGLGMLVKKRIGLGISNATILILVWVLLAKFVVRMPNLEFRMFDGITELMAPLSDSYLWFQLESYSKTGVVIGSGLTLLLFGLIAMAFAPLGQELGRLLDKSKNILWAYSVNIVASLLGMWAFALLSFLGVSPYLGLLFSAIGVWWLNTEKQGKITSLVCLVGVFVLLLPTKGHQPYEDKVTFWSPYQKLTLMVSDNPDDKLYRADGWYLEVNNVGYMGMLDLSQGAIEKKRGLIYREFEDLGYDISYLNQYDIPYKLASPAASVLIIGGGAGNDAAAAIRAGVKKIDIVEIDPQIVALGRKYHPEEPYSDPRVDVVVNDGRAYLENTNKKYDVVVMGLADSHTTSSSLTNVQLDNYLYTQESLERVKEVLDDDGVLVLSFEVTRPWIGRRIVKSVESAFGLTPYVFEVRSDGVYGWGGFMFAVSKDANRIESNLDNDSQLAQVISENQRAFDPRGIEPLTDDWPYIYLESRQLSALHVVVALMVLSGLFVTQKRLTEIRGFDFAFFMLGMGFMLYEFQNISRSSLVFGNTWMTNTFIVSGVLVFILLANFAVVKKWMTFGQAGLGLMASILMQVFIPLSFYTSLDGWLKVSLAVSLMNLPHFFSGVVFADLLARSRKKQVAFGSNLLGSAVGGFFENFSFLLGMKVLVWFALVFYGLGLWRKKSK